MILLLNKHICILCNLHCDQGPHELVVTLFILAYLFMIYLLFILTSSISNIIYSNTFVEIYVVVTCLFRFDLVFEYVDVDEFIFGFLASFMVD